MNKLLRNFFIAAMAVMSVGAMAQTTVTFDAAADKGTKTASDPGEDQVTKDGVTIAVSNGAMNLQDQYRCYKGATFTITSTVGNITKVEVSCTAEGDAKYGPGCFTDATAGAYAFEGKVGTWTGDAASFTMTASTNQVRMNTVIVTIGGSAEQSQEKVWDFTVIPAQIVDGTGNLRSSVGDHINDDQGASWSAFYNAAGVKDGEQFTVKEGELFEQTKGLTFGILDNDKMVLYRNYPSANENGENYGGCHLYFNKDVDVTIPAKKGQIIEVVLTSAKENKVCTSTGISEGIAVPVSKGSKDISGYAAVSTTVTEDNPTITFKSAVYVQKITVKDGGSAPVEEGQKWDFTKWSDATVAALKADAAASKTEGWSDVEKKADAEAGGEPTEVAKDNCFWFAGTANEDGTLSANNVVIEELKGLKFGNADYNAARSLAIAVNYKEPNASSDFGPYQGASYLWLGGKGKLCFTIPNVAAGSTITIEAESHKISDPRGLQLKQGDTQIGEDFKPTTFASNTWTIENAGDVDVWNTNGCHIYTITIKAGATGISTVKAQNVQSNVIYNLAGQKVGKDYKGIVIMNGKKVVLK